MQKKSSPSRGAVVSPARDGTNIQFHSINSTTSSTNIISNSSVNNNDNNFHSNYEQAELSNKHRYNISGDLYGNDGDGGSGGIEEVNLSLDDVGPNVPIEVESSRKEYAPGKGHHIGATFNVVNTIIGAGIIGLPFAMKECGLLAGMLLITVAAYLCRKSNLILVQSGELVGQLNYEELMEHLYGPAGFYAFCFFSFVMSFGAMAAYLIIVGDTIPQIVSNGGGGGVWADRNSVICICSLFFVLPVSSFRGLHHLSFTSFISVLADVILVIIVLAAGPSAAKSGYDDENDEIHEGQRLTVIRPTVFAGFGAISFAFVSQSSTFLIYRSLKSRSSEIWKGVVDVAMAIAWTLGITFAAGGYYIFVNQTEGDILNNLPTNNSAASVARAFLAVTMILTYPMEMVVARHVIDTSVCQRILQYGEMNGLRHYGWTFCIWTATVILGLATDDLGSVLEVFGAFAASALGYVMPAMMYLKANQRALTEDLQAWKIDSDQYRPRLIDRMMAVRRWWSTFFMLIFGLVAMIAGTITSIINSSSKN